MTSLLKWTSDQMYVLCLRAVTNSTCSLIWRERVGRWISCCRARSNILHIKRRIFTSCHVHSTQARGQIKQEQSLAKHILHPGFAWNSGEHLTSKVTSRTIREGVIHLLIGLRSSNLSSARLASFTAFSTSRWW